MPLNKSILLVGCGRMGSSMLTGIRNAGFSNITIIDPAHAENWAEHNQAPSGLFDIVVLAIKPQESETALPTLTKFLKPQTIILSIMAGVSLDKLSALTSHTGAIIRAMPNTPAMIGRGITAAVRNAQTSDDDFGIVKSLLRPLGEFVPLHDENLMNAVTAVSGSGPAYLFYLTDVIAKAGEAQGLPADIAMRLARQTMIGAAHLMETAPDSTVKDLREQVTSKGGTTEAALNILMQNNELQILFDKAIEAATNRF